MAWISVHEEVIGPKLRHFTKLVGCSRHEALGILITLWLWGIKNAEKSGYIKSADRDDVAEMVLIGLSGNLSARDVVDAMVKSGWIDEMDDGLYLHDWGEWQEFWYKYLDKKEQDAARKRRARERERETLDALKPLDNPTKLPETPKKPKKKTPTKIEYAEFVHMQESEYERLIEEYGEAAVTEFIRVLDSYKGSKGKTYKDDYRAILSWVVEKVKKEKPTLIKQNENLVEENPFEEWGLPNE